MAARLLDIAALCPTIAAAIKFAATMLDVLRTRRNRPPDSIRDFPALHISEWK